MATDINPKVMKNSLTKLYLLAFFLVSDFVLFAQPGQGTGDGDPPLEGDDDPPAPINSKVIYLAIVGVAFAAYYFSSRKRQSVKQ